MFVLTLLLFSLKFLFYSFLFLFLLLILIIIGYRVFIEPVKGVCKSKVKLHGKVALVTGGNSGIGLETARDLAARGATVVIACRNEQKSIEAIADIVATTGNNNVKYMYLNLVQFSSVRKFAEDFKKMYDRLDILVNNAGCAGLNQTLSADGIDLVMQVNYFSPFLLTNLLLDKLIASKPSRIVIVSSHAHKHAEIDLTTIHSPHTESYFMRYAASKLCDLLWAKALAKRLPQGVTVNALHPGIVKTAIFRRMSSWQIKLVSLIIDLVFKNAVEGAQTPIHVAVAEELDGVTGKYFCDCKEESTPKTNNCDELVEELWNKSVLLTQSDVPSKF